MHLHLFIEIQLAETTKSDIREERRDYGIRTSRKFTRRYYIFARVQNNSAGAERHTWLFAVRFDVESCI